VRRLGSERGEVGSRPAAIDNPTLQWTGTALRSAHRVAQRASFRAAPEKGKTARSEKNLPRFALAAHDSSRKCCAPRRKSRSADGIYRGRVLVGWSASTRGSLTTE